MHEWLCEQYPDYKGVKVSVHPKNQATKAAVAGASHALTYKKLEQLVAEARALLSSLCDSSLKGTDLIAACDKMLLDSPIRHDRLEEEFLLPFEAID